MDEPGKNESLADEPHKVQMILIVEDDEAIGDLIQQTLLLETPYQVIRASDSDQALKIVEQVKPQLFLLDYQLPLMNGLELAHRLHTLPELEQVPVILMSAHLPEAASRPRTLDFLKKPFELDTLLRIVNRHLEN
jgi:DNA-binding NtrC family response regulator